MRYFDGFGKDVTLYVKGLKQKLADANARVTELENLLATPEAPPKKKVKKLG